MRDIEIKKMRFLNNELGVGLIELLVSVIIMAGVVAAIMVAYTSLPANSSQGNALVVLQQDASLAMEEMALALRETGTGAPFNVAANQITTSDGTTYSVNGGLLYKNFGIAGQEILVGDYTFEDFGMQVSSLTFDDDSDDATPLNTVTITLVVDLRHTVMNKAGGGTTTSTVDTLTFNTKAYLRNRTI